MKVELSTIRLGVSPLTDKVHAGVPINNSIWKDKTDVTNDFIACVIEKYCGYKEVVSDSEGTKYEIQVKKIA